MSAWERLYRVWASETVKKRKIEEESGYCVPNCVARVTRGKSWAQTKLEGSWEALSIFQLYIVWNEHFQTLRICSVGLVFLDTYTSIKKNERNLKEDTEKEKIRHLFAEHKGKADAEYDNYLQFRTSGPKDPEAGTVYFAIDFSENFSPSMKKQPWNLHFMTGLKFVLLVCQAKISRWKRYLATWVPLTRQENRC